MLMIANLPLRDYLLQFINFFVFLLQLVLQLLCSRVLRRNTNVKVNWQTNTGRERTVVAGKK